MTDFLKKFLCAFRVIFTTRNKKKMITKTKTKTKQKNAQPTDPTWQVHQPVKQVCFFFPYITLSNTVNEELYI